VLLFLRGSAWLRPETPDLTIRLVLQDRVLTATTRRTLSDTALGTRRNDPTAHSPTVSAADIPTSPGCAPGSEPTHRRSELRSRRTCWPQYRSNALGEQRVEPAGDPAGVC
jgi:hypothetical protein